MKESCCQFGPDGALAGIVSEPAKPARGTAVVLVSAGLTPKFGPFRLYTELARRLAEDGFHTLRFDLGGLGDSAHAHGDQPLAERTRLEVGAALDYLYDQFALDSVTLAGLCSGAEDSFRHAEHDSRVKRVVMIDPFAYKTAGFAWRDLRSRARRRLLRALGLYRPLAHERARSLVDYEYLAPAESTRILQHLLRRNVQLDFIYTGGMSRSFNHRQQLRAMFPATDFHGLVQVEHFPQLDHTQLLEADRSLLISAVARLLRNGRGSNPPE
jgi:pimeloyl-ACP methyl ester carboxylesterase